MSQAVIRLVDEFRKLSPRERVEFFSMATEPKPESAEDLTESDFSAIAAQTFGRLDAEEEKNGIE